MNEIIKMIKAIYEGFVNLFSRKKAARGFNPVVNEVKIDHVDKAARPVGRISRFKAMRYQGGIGRYKLIHGVPLLFHP